MPSAVQLRGGCLVEARLLLEAEDPHRLEQPERPEGVDVAGVLGLLERDGDVALRGEVVDLVRLDLLDDPGQVRGVGEIAVVQEEADALLVRVAVEVVDRSVLNDEARRLMP